MSRKSKAFITRRRGGRGEIANLFTPRSPRLRVKLCHLCFFRLCGDDKPLFSGLTEQSSSALCESIQRRLLSLHGNGHVPRLPPVQQQCAKDQQFHAAQKNPAVRVSRTGWHCRPGIAKKHEIQRKVHDRAQDQSITRKVSTTLTFTAASLEPERG